MDEKEKKPKKKNIHSGHRHRVRQRFLKENSLESFEEYQIVELLLFYAYPMKDTNEMAHKLLDTYGSFHNLLAAGADDLMARGNLTEGAAVLISMLPHIARRYENSFYSKKEQIDTFARASAYLTTLLSARPFESFVLLCLDINKRLINYIYISDGTTDGTKVYIDKVVEKALINKAKFVIIGHNHPSGNREMSNADYVATTAIIRSLEPLGIKVLDHIIVCDKNWKNNFSFAKEKYFGLKCNISAD